LQPWHPSSYCGKVELIVQESGSENIESITVGIVEMGVSFCPSFSVANVMDLQEDKHNDESKGLQCTMSWILVQ
jgi:hypothetical protein